MAQRDGAVENVVTGDLFAPFRGRRILITGHTGFKGSWLSLWLAELGAEVTGFALPPEGERAHFSLLGLAPRIRHILGDVRDLDALRSAVADADPHFVFHLAAQSLVRRSYQEPKLTFDTNVGGTVNILEALREAPNLIAAVIITSDKCYLNREWVWSYRETDRLGGLDPYSASKAAAENAFLAYQASFYATRPAVGIASARAGNVIGGGDWAADRILPDCIRALERGQPITLRNPSATRPWQHVLEPLSGYLTLAFRLANDPKTFGGSWNFGPAAEDVCTVEEVARRAVHAWGGRNEIVIQQSADQQHEHRLLQLNIEKARQILDWKPRWRVATAIEQSVAWYKAVLDGRSALDVSREQIALYSDHDRRP